MTARKPRQTRPAEWVEDDNGPYAAGWEDGWQECERHWWPVIRACGDLVEAFSGDHGADATAIGERIESEDEP